MPLPFNGIQDDFNRANGAIGANWVTPGIGDPSNVVISSNRAKSADTQNAYAMMTSLGAIADFEAFATCAVLPTSGNYIALAGRATTADAGATDVYLLRVYPSTALFDIRKKVSGAGSVSIGSASAAGFSAGDKFMFTGYGTTLKGYRYSGGSWTEIVSVTDSSITAAGYIGLGLSDGGSLAALDDFGGGSYDFVAFPSTPILDTFVRANEDPLAAPWTTISELNGFEIDANEGKASFNAYDGSYRGSYADVEVYATIKTYTASDHLLTARFQDAGGASPIRDSRRRGYQFTLGPSQDYNYTRMDDGSSGATLLGPSLLPVSLTSGDAFGIRIVGDFHELWIRSAGAWRLLATVTDATYLGAATIAIQSSDLAARYLDFGGGAYGPPAVPTSAYVIQRLRLY